MKTRTPPSLEGEGGGEGENTATVVIQFSSNITVRKNSKINSR